MQVDLKCNHKDLYKSKAERDVTTEGGTGSNTEAKCWSMRGRHHNPVNARSFRNFRKLEEARRDFSPMASRKISPPDTLTLSQ